MKPPKGPRMPAPAKLAVRGAGIKGAGKQDRSDLEVAMEIQLVAAPEISEFVTEHHFAKHLKRRWRFDFAWLDEKVALEVEGGIYSGGRHVQPEGFIEDAVKYNTATLLGWRVIRVVEEHILSGDALRWVGQALNGFEGPDEQE